MGQFIKVDKMNDNDKTYVININHIHLIELLKGQGCNIYINDGIKQLILGTSHSYLEIVRRIESEKFLDI
jgi:hypothetical protein